MGELVCPACGNLVSAKIDLNAINVSRIVVEKVPESIIREHVVFPVFVSGNRLFLAAAGPKDSELISVLSYILDHEVFLILASEEDILTAFRRHFE